MKNLFLSLALLLFADTFLFSQTDATSESQNNMSAYRNVSGNENIFSSFTGESRVPQNLMQQYNNAVDSRNEQQKIALGKEVDKYLDKPNVSSGNIDIINITGEIAPYQTDWYNSDVLVSNTEVANYGGYRQMDLKQGEDGWMYLAVNRRNVPGYNGCITVFRSSNGGVNWSTVNTIASVSGYFGSLSMLVESRLNSNPDSTRIIIYATLSSTSNLNGANLTYLSFRRDGSGFNSYTVSTPAAGNRYVYPSACSDGVFWESVTFMHAVVREETNSGTYVNMLHFRTTNWGAAHTVGVIAAILNDQYPSAAFSNEVGSDSIYIAVERYISPTESEIRLIATVEVPVNTWTVRYITDAQPGIRYERPCITVQQRNFSVPQRILITCTKNDKAVYHFSTDGGSLWNIDYGLGPNWMSVDYTSCSSDSTVNGGRDFIAAFVNLSGDSVNIRHGELGLMGTPLYKRNSVAGTSTLAPTCSIYKLNGTKNSAFAYAGVGPANVLYNMETLITGITPVSNEIPNGFNLSQNYPNPFNPATNIKFALPKSSFVKLVVYDISGREVETLVNENLNAGTFNVDWDASQYSSGVYFYKLVTDGFTETRKMILVK